MICQVEFFSEGAILRGRLYTPDEVKKPAALIVMAHGFSATINGMTADQYAEGFYQAGFATLLYDHRNFGISDGEPRQEINRWVQARGYRDAISFARTLPEIDADRISIWGDSSSGAEAIVVGAIDSRVKAIIAQVPACGREPPPSDPDGVLFSLLRETFQNGDVSGTPETTKGPLPVVTFDQLGTPSFLEPITAFRWFIEYGARFGTHWQNRATVITPSTPAPFHPVLCAPFLKAPLLIVISPEDEMPGANPAVTRIVYTLAPQPKELFEIEGGHFGLVHYPSQIFDLSSHIQCDFLVRCLA
jgi:pimeloyl-ACP methyl ester carboxylesterase